MGQLSTTKMSSRGQVVIPEAIREQMHLKPGTHFVVMGEGDVLILKAITPPSMDDFDRLITRAKEHAAQAGLTEEDIAAAVRDVRSEK